jgi:hypothetical protein
VSSLCVVLYGWLGREEEFPNWKTTYLSWQGKKKKESTDLEVGAGFTSCFSANNPMRSEGR